MLTNKVTQNLLISFKTTEGNATQKIINDPNLVVEDMLKGFVKCHQDLVAPTDDARVLKDKHAPIPGKVGVVTGGGSGHAFSEALEALKVAAEK